MWNSVLNLRSTFCEFQGDRKTGAGKSLPFFTV
jgi:hypothetical protein